MRHRRWLMLASLGLVLATAPAAACVYENVPKKGRLILGSVGYITYGGLLVPEGVNTGTKLPSYQGSHQGSIEACVRACRAEGHCTGVTWRPQVQPNNCLKFADVNFETGETMNLPLQTGWPYTSVLVRWPGMDGLECAVELE